MSLSRTNTIETLNNWRELGQVTLRTLVSQSANVTVETPIFIAPIGPYVQNVEVVSVTISPSTAITGAATNLQTFTVKRYSSAGTHRTPDPTGSYVTTASVAKFGSANVVTGTGGFSLNPGDVLTIVDTPSASGAATPEITVAVTYRVNPTSGS